MSVRKTEYLDNISLVNRDSTVYLIQCKEHVKSYVQTRGIIHSLLLVASLYFYNFYSHTRAG